VAPSPQLCRVGPGEHVEEDERERADQDDQHDAPENSADDVAGHDWLEFRDALPGPAAWRRDPSRVGYYGFFNEVNAKSQPPSFQRSLTPATFLLSMLGWLSKSSGTASALLTIILSPFAHACARAVGLTTRDAAFIAALSFGSLT